jgi:hypothetical protein
MQSVQVQNVGILLAKKGYNSEGADVGLKAFVKYKNVGSGTKSLNGIPIWRTAFTISDWEWSALPVKAGRVSGMKSRNWGWCPRSLKRSSFPEM